MKDIKIGNKKIGGNNKPFIIAEMSGNHNQSLETALKIVDKVAATGADALKLQTYTPETMTLQVDRKEFTIDDSDSLWKGETLYSLYEKAHTPWEWHEAIFQRCKELDLIAFSSPFDESSVDFLESLNVPVYKIASFENVDIPLIKKVAATKKPIIISTGMASVSEIDEAVKVAKNHGCEQLILLNCTSTYPSTPENSNILTIPHMKTLFNCEVGLSDHTLGVGVAVASVALGASVIEKHFTLSRSAGGVDSDFSLEPDEFKLLVEETNRAWESLGKVHYGPVDDESPSLKLRRSLYITQDMNEGETLTLDNVKAIRPGFGLSPKYLDLVLGKKITKSVEKGTPLTFEILTKM